MSRSVYAVRSVFTPTVPATLSFVERESLNERLLDALQTPGKQIVVYGHSGSGKSTLLINKVSQVYGEQKIVTRCTIATTFENLLLTAFDQLDVFYLASASVKNTKTIKGGIEQSYFALKASIEANASTENQQTMSRLLPPQLTPQKLAELCGAAECCWILEDFHKVPGGEKAKLSQIMKVFTDTAIDYPLAKIIAVGAVDTARQVIEYDNEMRTRVAEIEVPMMTSEELANILQKGENLLNIRFGSHKQEISKYSSGLGAICHQIALNICLAAHVEHTCDRETRFKTEQFRSALRRYLDNSSDSLKAVFDKATKRERGGKFDNTRLILKALTLLGQNGATYAEIFQKIHQEQKLYPSGNLTAYLKELQGSKRASVIRLDGASGKYFFSDPLYFAFAQCHFVPPKESNVYSINLLGESFTIESFQIALDAVAGQLDSLSERAKRRRVTNNSASS